MRPVLCLLGKCELTVEGSPVPFEITRKVWHVLGLVATAPRCFIGRNELMEAAWPLSDKTSRNVLIFKWRRSLVDALEPYVPDSVVLVTEQDVSLNPEYIDIDYQQCCSLAKIALTSDNALQVIEAGTAFDVIAEDKVLLLSFSSAFLEIREQFDKQRRAVLRRAWQAEAFLYPETKAVKSRFEIRLHKLGDDNPIGESHIPFKGIPGEMSVPEQPGRAFSGTSQLVASVLIGGMIVTPIVLGSLNTPPKLNLRISHGKKVDRPTTDLSQRVMYQLSANRVKNSQASAIAITPKNMVIAAGNATLTSGEHQTVIVMLTKSGQARWVTKLNDAIDITTTPRKIVSSESGRIYVASVLRAGRNNARKLAPGSYLSVCVFDRDGKRIFERLHSEALDGSRLHPIKLIKDLKGGVHALAISARERTTIAMHVPAGPSTTVTAPLTGFPKGFLMTDAITDGKGRIFLFGYVNVKTGAGMRLDWHIKAMDKASKTLWSRDITGGNGPAGAPVRGIINPEGDVVAYGPLPALDKRHPTRQVASMVIMSSTTGRTIVRDCYDSEYQNPNFALSSLATGRSAAIAVTSHSPDGSAPLTLHRFGNAATDTALTLTVRFPGYKRVESIMTFSLNNYGAVTALLQPDKQTSSRVALTYMSMFFGRGIETGDLSTSKPFAYNAYCDGFFAGHYNNMFCVYDFSKLP